MTSSMHHPPEGTPLFAPPSLAAFLLTDNRVCGSEDGEACLAFAITANFMCNEEG